MLRIEPGSLIWRYWVLTVVLLYVGVGGYEPAFLAAIALSCVQVVHFQMREGSVAAFPVQVRIGFLLWLVIAQVPSLQWLYWVPVLGTTASVLFDYCPLARALSLAPWNRREPLSRALIKRTVLSAPVHGSILDLPTVASVRTP